MRKVYDISEPISAETAVFPGDTPYTQEWVMRMADGASCDVSTMRMSVHCGTHADAPSHYVQGEPDIAGVDLDRYLGRCRLLEVSGTGDPSHVGVESPSGGLAAAVEGIERVILRTARGHDHTVFNPKFTALGPAAAQVLVDAGVRLVGIDTPSMDDATNKTLDAHHILQSGDVRLLENLDLTGVPAGDYELIALPLKIVGGDASPVRAVLRELP